jgi:hypothetical protein
MLFLKDLPMHTMERHSRNPIRNASRMQAHPHDFRLCLILELQGLQFGERQMATWPARTKELAWGFSDEYFPHFRYKVCRLETYSSLNSL